MLERSVGEVRLPRGPELELPGAERLRGALVGLQQPLEESIGVFALVEVDDLLVAAEPCPDEGDVQALAVLGPREAAARMLSWSNRERDV